VCGTWFFTFRLTGQTTGAGEHDAEGYIWTKKTGINTRLEKNFIIRSFEIV